MNPIARLAQRVARPPGPLFQPHQGEVEGPERYAAAYKHNAPFATPGPTGYQTQLNQRQEGHFRDWLHNHAEEGHLPGGFNPNAKHVDYDMRGYWLSLVKRGALQNGNAGESGLHFEDKFKTPFDTTFSSESQYSTPDNPFVWHEGRLINKNNGRVIVGRQK